VVVAKFHTEKVGKNQIFDHSAKNLNSHLTTLKKFGKIKYLTIAQKT
jgi:hypothetical protein